MTNLHDLIRKYAFEKYVHSGVIAAVDLLISIIATAIAVSCVDIFVIPEIPLGETYYIMLISVAIATTVVAILSIKTHKVIIRHSTLADIWRLAVAVIIKEAIVGAVLIVSDVLPAKVNITIIALDAMILFCGLVVVRIAMIIAYEYLKQSMIADRSRKNTLIYGVSDKSIALEMRLHNSLHYNIKGFIQFGKSAAGDKLSGVSIFSFSDADGFKTLIESHEIEAILFPNYETARDESQRLVGYCTAANVAVLVAPPIDEVVDGKIMQSSIREIKIEDLLGRDEIKISMHEIIANFQNKTVLVTGAAGSIGSELCRQLATFGIGKLVLFDNAETPMHNIRLELEERFPDVPIVPIVGDVRQIQRLDYVFRAQHPQVVFHAAAYKHVPLMEENPCEGVLVNVAGSRHVADMCIKYGAEMMVMISTDKAVNPTNIMGCTKRLAEIYVQSLGRHLEVSGEGRTKFVTTRFGNVLGSNGSVIPRFREQIMKGGPVTVTHPDITRFFMTIPEACRLVMEAATMNVGNRICVFDMGKSVKIADLAKNMIKLAGFRVGQDIKIEYTGLRPGEKLYEEVLSNTENTTATPHEKIRIAQVREYDYDKAGPVMDELERLAYEVSIMDMVKLMKETVPEFISRNSQFEALDKQ